METLQSNPKLTNVFVMPSSSVTYAGVSMLVNTLDGMHALLLSNPSWDYFINLSGSDYPLTSKTAIRRLLRIQAVKTHPTNFVHYSTNRKSWDVLAKHRLGRLPFDFSLGLRPNHIIELVESPFKHPLVSKDNAKIVVAKGESWVMCTGPLVNTPRTATLDVVFWRWLRICRVPPSIFSNSWLESSDTE